MNVTLNAAPITYTVKAYEVKNPNQMSNAFTATDEYMAAETLKLRDKEKIDELKYYVKDFDMTSISSQDLKKIGHILYRSDIINFQDYAMFMDGNLTEDEKGRRIDTHVKFNAIALFSERLEDYSAFLKKYPGDVNKHTLGVRQGMITANRALGALTYFSNSARNGLFVDESV